MTYTQLAVCVVALVVGIDVWLLRTRILLSKFFWQSYLIVVGFQLVTNGLLTGYRIVQYDADNIIGSKTPVFFGDWHIAFAPIEDLLFGFSLIVLTLALWVWWGRRGVQREPRSGPPRWASRSRPKA